MPTSRRMSSDDILTLPTGSASAGSSKNGSPPASKPSSKPGSKTGSRRNSKELALKEKAKVEPPQLTEEERAVMVAATEKLNELIERGVSVRDELREAEEMDCPRLAERGRRKTRELEEEAMAVMNAAGLERAFKTMDLSGDGQLDRTELKRAFELAGRPATDEALDKAIAALDKNNDGLVSQDEFKAIAWQVAITGA